MTEQNNDYKPQIRPTLEERLEKITDPELRREATHKIASLAFQLEHRARKMEYRHDRMKRTVENMREGTMQNIAFRAASRLIIHDHKKMDKAALAYTQEKARILERAENLLRATEAPHQVRKNQADHEIVPAHVVRERIQERIKNRTEEMKHDFHADRPHDRDRTR